MALPEIPAEWVSFHVVVDVVAPRVAVIAPFLPIVDLAGTIVDAAGAIIDPAVSIVGNLLAAVLTIFRSGARLRPRPFSNTRTFAVAGARGKLARGGWTVLQEIRRGTAAGNRLRGGNARSRSTAAAGQIEEVLQVLLAGRSTRSGTVAYSGGRVPTLGVPGRVPPPGALGRVPADGALGRAPAEGPLGRETLGDGRLTEGDGLLTDGEGREYPPPPRPPPPPRGPRADTSLNTRATRLKAAIEMIARLFIIRFSELLCVGWRVL
jgi:hypothetical protein